MSLSRELSEIRLPLGDQRGPYGARRGVRIRRNSRSVGVDDIEARAAPLLRTAATREDDLPLPWNGAGSIGVPELTATRATTSTSSSRLIPRSVGEGYFEFKVEARRGLRIANRGRRRRGLPSILAPCRLAERTYVRFHFDCATRARLAGPAGGHARGARDAFGGRGRAVALRNPLDLRRACLLAPGGSHGRGQSRRLYGRHRLLAGSRADPLLEEADFVVFDLETTGLPATHCCICELGAVRVRASSWSARFSRSSIRRRPPGAGRALDRLRAGAQGAPSVSSVLKRFRSFAGRDLLVAHNARFDQRFLERQLLRVHGRRLSSRRSAPLRLPGGCSRSGCAESASPRSPSSSASRRGPAIERCAMPRRPPRSWCT